MRYRGQVEDAAGHLRPDMYVNVAIAVDLGDVPALPQDAVFETGDHRLVFVDRGEGLFEPRDVILGAKADGYYEVKSGVADGEAVVTSGNFLVDSESRLKAALQGMILPPARPAEGRPEDTDDPLRGSRAGGGTPAEHHHDP